MEVQETRTICKSENHSHFKRENNVLIEVLETGEEVQKIRFTFSKFPDWKKLSDQGVRYMKRYMRMWPNYFERVILEPTETNVGQLNEQPQLTLF